MKDTRIVKQVVFGTDGAGLDGPRRGGARQLNWLDHVAAAMQEWGIDAARAERLNYTRFKRLLHNTLPRVWAARLAAERAQKPALDAYMSRFGAEPVQFKSAKSYLCGADACNRGKELVLQLRTGSLPLASLTGKFGRSRRDDPDNPTHFCCPVCSSAVESVSHFLLDCPKYDSLRGDVWRRLEAVVAAERWQELQQMSSDAKAAALLNIDFLGGSHVASVVAPFVYACWQLRWKVRNEEVRSHERGADGSDAMA